MPPLPKSPRTNLPWAQSPEHSVLPGASTYDVRQMRFAWGYGGLEEGALELEMSTHDDYVTLRFTGIKELSVPAGQPLSSVSIRIIDCSEYLPEMPAPIRVQHAKGGGLSFWAQEVVRMAACSTCRTR
jgi:hypothetical protein